MFLISFFLDFSIPVTVYVVNNHVLFKSFCLKSNAHAILIISNQYCNFSLSEYVLPFYKIGTHQRRCRYQLKLTALTIRILLFTFLNKIVVFSFKQEQTDDSRFLKILITLHTDTWVYKNEFCVFASKHAL